MGSWGKWGIVLLVAAVALPVATVVGKGGEAGAIPEKQTSCWPCHVGWPDPLKTFYQIVPPKEAGAATGEEFNYVVQLQNPWLEAITFIEPTLVIGGAPSLSFAGGPEPLPSIPLPGSVKLNPALPGVPVGQGFVTINIPVGMTYVDVQLVPADASPTGPTFTLNIYTGATQPAGTPAYHAKARTAGQTVEATFDGTRALSAVGGTGNWTIQALVENVTEAGVPRGQTLPFTAIVSARSEAGGTSLVQAQGVNIAKHASFLFTFGLKATKDPGPDEVVGLRVNATVFYEHKDKGTDNFANITKTFEQTLKVQKADDGRIVVLAPDTVGPKGVTIKNGASMDTVSEAVGYATAFLLISSIWTGGMFGKASRRQLNHIFTSAKRRVAFHNFLSYGLILAAVVHTVLFILEPAYYWTLGVLWGGLAILSMAGLGITGAWQVGMIRRWNYATWRWSHYGLSVAAILFTLFHMGLDGVHFGFVQEWLHWNDPLDPRKVTK